MRCSHSDFISQTQLKFFWLVITQTLNYCDTFLFIFQDLLITYNEF